MIRILTIGKLNKKVGQLFVVCCQLHLKNWKALNNGPRTTYHGHRNGFTLLELIVVMSLLGIMLIFTVPRFHETLFLDETKTGSRWIIGKIMALKEAAIRNQKQYSLHINLDTEQFWETDASMSAEELENAALNASSLPDGLKIADIEYPIRGKITSGQTDITFYKNGTSDKVLIHIQNDDQYESYLIEPFLSEVTRYEIYASFEN
ncbi:MAG: type II secretion system protein [Desulfobacterales bacterium]